MAMPKEFDYADEDDFVQRFLIPLLHRLGYSVVANYHRSRGEFGKDLIFAEIDRFGHIRYSGLQAKYEESIGLKAIETVVQDCRQAFANPFTHPHTKVQERIQTFYAINAGSFSDDATTQFFNEVGQPLSTCCRLIGGKDLLILDRWASAGQSQVILPSLNGLRIEIDRNSTSGMMLQQALRHIDGNLDLQAFNHPFKERIPLQRFRNHSASACLTIPLGFSDDFVTFLDAYWSVIDTLNSRLDLLEHPITQGEASIRIDEILSCVGLILDYGTKLKYDAATIAKTLAPLVAN